MTTPKRRKMSSSSSKKSSSNFVIGANLSSLPLLLGSLSTFNPEDFDEMKHYDLLALLQPPKLSEVDKMSSEELCSMFFEKVDGMKEMNKTVRKKVPGLEKLYPLYVTTDQRPDLTVSRKVDNLPLILVEVVHSSPFAATVRKTILGVTDQLRLYRTYDANITRCVGFAFPKKNLEQCVVIVAVTWEKLCFRYTLTPIKEIKTVRGTIERELRAVTMSAPSRLNQELRFLVPLSQEDLRFFGDGTEGSPVQLPSRASILVRHGMDYFKSPAMQDEVLQLEYLQSDPSILQALPIIKLQRVTVVGTTHYYYKYRGIPNDPLTRPEAKSCLYDLVQKLVQVIESFHKCGWAHQDIRLQNICFDKDYMPVFIDLDRCKQSSSNPYAGEGCMYSMRGSASQTDWLQLGLVVCWVLDLRLGQEEGEEGDYHTRDCKKICESLKDPFLKSLIGEGKLDQVQLNEWCKKPSDVKTLETVLCQRNKEK